MIYGTHVFLGPSLDLETAQSILPQAHYHNPIECGDIIRLLRLEPKKLIIIDGLYETVPAVWHKEILLCLELGIEVWGAASMGALRAAELHHFGMNGFGFVFRAFKAGALQDDDEVAVLHQSAAGNFKPINEAMIDIRMTCKQAFLDKVITREEKKALINYCKAQFYPYRSLKRAVEQCDLKNRDRMQLWFNEHNIKDVKKIDAIGVLKYHRNRGEPNPLPNPAVCTPKTIFLNSLTFESNLTPFKLARPWLPPIEKQLQVIYQESPQDYMLIAEMAAFTIRLFSLITQNTASIDNDVLQEYIVQNRLYSPEHDFYQYKDHSILSGVYALICQVVCLEHVTQETIEHNILILGHYYGFSSDIARQCAPILRKLYVLIFAVVKQMDSTLLLTDDTIDFYLKNVVRYRNYDSETFKTWLHPTHIDKNVFIQFVFNYIKVTFPRFYPSYHYYQWIYDAYNLCKKNLGSRCREEQEDPEYELTQQAS
jgi:hypothetical protein